MSNVVFFGQADAGKSTMAGYLVSRYVKDFSLSRFVRSAEREYPGFDKRLAYSAIVNTNRDETGPANLHKLNSMATHLRNIALPFGRVTVIDTPGSERFVRQRERGIYYGNVGIFFMEVSNLISRKYMSNTVAPLMLWSKLRNKRMVFLVSKMDTVGYDRECFDQALNEVRRIFGEVGYRGDAIVIPTAIDVDALGDAGTADLDSLDPGENIVRLSGKMAWYDGPTVVDAIGRQVELADEGDSNERLLFCVADQVDKPSSSVGKVWNIKLLSGILHVGDLVSLAPVKDRQGNFSAVTARVKTIRGDISKFEEREDMRTARKGQICGLDLSMVHMNGRTVNKSDFNAVSTTCGFKSESEYKMSDTLVLEISQSDEEAFAVNSMMKLLWFGRAVSFTIASLEGKGEHVLATARLTSRQIALPTVPNGEIVPEAVLIKGAGYQEFYNARLVGVGEE